MLFNNNLSVDVTYIQVLALCSITLILVFVKRMIVSKVYGWKTPWLYPFFGTMFLVDLIWACLEHCEVKCGMLAIIANAIWYIAFVSTAGIWLHYCINTLNNGNAFKNHKILHLIWVPILGAIVVIICSCWTGRIVSATEDGHYLRGPYYWTMFIVFSVYVLVSSALCIVKLIKSDDKIEKRLLFTLTLVPLPLLITAILQAYNGFGFIPIGVISSVAIFELDKQRRVMDSAIANDRMRSEVFNMVSHDIRTPLTAIIGFSELLKRNKYSDDEVKHMHNAILTSGQILLTLVNDVLDTSRMEMGKLSLHPEPTDIKKLVLNVFEVLSSAADSHGLTLSKTVDDIPTLMIDGHRVTQVMINLLGNGIKNTEKGSVQISVQYTNGNLIFKVSDTGCGMSKADLKRVMMPFVQVGELARRQIGSGLGLSICRRLVELMKGKITVESELGKGTTFTVSIPCEIVQEVSKNEVTMPTSSKSRKLRVLVVDDMALNQSVIVKMLSMLGHDSADTASDGMEALEMLRNNPTGYDVVLTDFQMPNMDGEALIRAIRNDGRWDSLPVYVVTADVTALMKHKECGFTGVLMKPITIKGLESLLEKC